MLKVGITGGMGGGKSTVSKILSVLGYPVYSSDEKAKFLMNHDPELKKAIQNLFGNSIYQNGQLDRVTVSKLVFSEPGLLSKLEHLVHPVVLRDFDAWSKDQPQDIIFKEAAILFESGGYKKMDRVICVTADEQIRIQRVLNRDTLTREEITNRMEKQWPDEEKIKRSDFVIHADDNHSVIKQVLEVVSELKKLNQ